MTIGYLIWVPAASVINCDNLATLPMTLFDETPAGRLGPRKTAELDKALRFALDIVF